MVLKVDKEGQRSQNTLHPLGIADAKHMRLGNRGIKAFEHDPSIAVSQQTLKIPKGRERAGKQCE